MQAVLAWTSRQKPQAVIGMDCRSPEMQKAERSDYGRASTGETKSWDSVLINRSCECHHSDDLEQPSALHLQTLPLFKGTRRGAWEVPRV